MSDETIRQQVLDALKTVAPEIDPLRLRSDRPLREEVDLDSMDWLNFLVALSARFGVDVPESEYGRLVTLADVIDYLMTRRTE